VGKCNYIRLAHDRDRRPAHVNKIMNLRVPLNLASLLSNCLGYLGTGCFYILTNFNYKTGICNIDVMNIAGSSFHAVRDVGLDRLEAEVVGSNSACHGCLSSSFCVVLSCVGSGLKDGFITRPKESYQVSK
jgi:hypothetical protein